MSMPTLFNYIKDSGLFLEWCTYCRFQLSLSSVSQKLVQNWGQGSNALQYSHGALQRYQQSQSAKLQWPLPSSTIIARPVGLLGRFFRSSCCFSLSGISLSTLSRHPQKVTELVFVIGGINIRSGVLRRCMQGVPLMKILKCFRCKCHIAEPSR